MSLSFRILKSHGLVYVRYEGFARLEDTMRVFGEYAQHPDCRPGQKQLVDLSDVTGIEENFAELMKLQAAKADVFMAEGAQTIIVYYAPNSLSRRMCNMIVRSWEPFDSVVALVIEDEGQALSVLGLAETSIAQLLTTAA